MLPCAPRPGPWGDPCHQYVHVDLSTRRDHTGSSGYVAVPYELLVYLAREVVRREEEGKTDALPPDGA